MRTMKHDDTFDREDGVTKPKFLFEQSWVAAGPYDFTHHHYNGVDLYGGQMVARTWPSAFNTVTRRHPWILYSGASKLRA